MFEKLFELILQFLDGFQFATIIDAYEEAVVLRFGKFSRTLGPGFHWVWPLWIEKVLNENVVVHTTRGNNQILTTLDGKAIIISGTIRWSINDIKKSLLGVGDLYDAWRDITFAQISRLVQDTSWEDIRKAEFNDKLTTACRKIGWRYGVEVEAVQVTDLALTRSFTLNQN